MEVTNKFKLWDMVYFYKNNGLYCGVVFRVLNNSTYEIGHNISELSLMREEDLLTLDEYIKEAREREKNNAEWFRRQEEE